MGAAARKSDSVESEGGKLTFASGEIIVNEGDSGGNLLIIKSGSAEVFLRREGNDLPLAVLGPGEIIGVMTATTGTLRAASIRAKTATVVQEIPRAKVKALVGQIPPWANALIKDLVLRVEQADRLYTKTAVAIANGAKSRYLDSAIRLAESFQPVAEMFIERDSDGKCNVNHVLNKVAGIIDLSLRDLDTIFAIICKHNLLPFSGSKHGHYRISAEQIEPLTYFSKMVKAARQEHMLEELMTNIAIGERRLLGDIYNLFGLGADPYATIHVPFDSVENELKAASKSRFDSQALKSAERLKIVKIERKPGSIHQLIFTPNDLDLRLKCIEILITLNELEEAPFKLGVNRTLVY